MIGAIGVITSILYLSRTLSISSVICAPKLLSLLSTSWLSIAQTATRALIHSTLLLKVLIGELTLSRIVPAHSVLSATGCSERTFHHLTARFAKVISSGVTYFVNRRVVVEEPAGRDLIEDEVSP